jgi:hypothetical protein
MMVHALFQILGGADEHRFRVLDLAVTGLSFAIAGALLPGVARAARPVAPVERAAWATGTWVALTAQYLAYGFWDTAQRESFLDWFVLVAIALQASLGDLAARRARPVLFSSGLLSLVPWLGKPTFALFTASQLLALTLEPGALRLRARRLAWFIAGGAVGVLVPLAWTALRGDLHAWARITFVDVPAMYRFMWHRPASAILSMPGYRSLAWTGGLTAALLLGLVASRRLPIRALPVATMPVLGLVSVVLQAKGFPYHFHPVTLGTTFAWVVVVAAAWEGALGARPPLAIAVRGAALAAAGAIGAHALVLARRAPYPLPPPPAARDAASLAGDARLSAFERVDFFPRALRDAAAYVSAHTRPDERVQTYGMDAYVLFLARRRSATPYIYAYDLNADAAMHGSFDPDGLVPTAPEVERIRALVGAHAVDLRARLERSPPAAFVFVARSPLTSDPDAVADFEAHCPEAAAWVSARYREAADFDGVRVWLPIREAPLKP